MQSECRQQLIFLKGWPSKREYVRRLKLRAGATFLDDLELLEEWAQAHALVCSLAPLAPREAKAPASPLPETLAKSAAAAIDDPACRRCLGTVPSEWAMVRLDELIVWQKHVSLTFAERLASRLPPSPSEECVLDFVLGQSGTAPDVALSGSGNRYTTSSISNDIRVLETAPLDVAHVQSIATYGRVAAAVAVLIGYSINIMMAVQMGARLVLINGTHRAYALRMRGVTHAPCLIRKAANSEDLDLLSPPTADQQALAWHFGYPRPPLLSDFFQDELVRMAVAPVHQYLIQLDLSFSENRVPLVRQQPE